MATTAQRAHLHALMDEMRGFASQLDYPPGDQRDSRDDHSWRLTETNALHVLRAGGRLQMDCSEWGSWLLKCAGLWRWSEPGWTGSHLKLLPIHYVNAKVARTGALVVFGGGDGHHEAMVYEADPEHGNPILCSHGQPGLSFPMLSVEQAWQTTHGHAGVRFLSIAHL